MRESALPSSSITGSDPFRKGNLAIIHRNYVSYNKLTEKGVSNTESDQLRIGANAVYFVVDHLGVGLDASFLSDHFSTPGIKENQTGWAFYPSLTYGRMLSERISGFIRISGGPSRNRSYLKNGITPNIVESKFTNLRGTIGFPILLEEGQDLYLTPYFLYDKYEGDWRNHHIRDVTRNFGFRLESYLPTGKRSLSGKRIEHHAGKYKAGNSFLEYSTTSGFYSAKHHETQGDILFADRKTSGKQIGLGFGTYFFDNLGGLLELGLGSSKSGTGQGAQKTSTVNIHPSISAQLPVDGLLNNFFLQAGYNYTHIKETGNNITNRGYLGLRAGYNLFFTRSLALTPKLGYELGKQTSKSTGGGGDRISKYRGPAAELGIRAWLNWKWN